MTRDYDIANNVHVFYLKVHLLHHAFIQFQLKFEF
jgi:hypothetical protein